MGGGDGSSRLVGCFEGGSGHRSNLAVYEQLYEMKVKKKKKKIMVSGCVCMQAGTRIKTANKLGHGQSLLIVVVASADVVVVA